MLCLHNICFISATYYVVCQSIMENSKKELESSKKELERTLEQTYFNYLINFFK